MANILLLGIFSLLSGFHPLHVSVTEIEHDAEKKRLEIVMRVFIDDLELSIKNDLKKEVLDITQPGEGYSTDGLIQNYIKSRFKVEVNGKQEDIVYVGHEIELPVVYIYIKVDKIKKVKDISVYNSMIMEIYDDQANLVHVEANGNLKSMKLNENRKKDFLAF